MILRDEAKKKVEVFLWGGEKKKTRIGDTVIEGCCGDDIEYLYQHSPYHNGKTDSREEKKEKCHFENVQINQRILTGTGEPKTGCVNWGCNNGGCDNGDCVNGG